MTESFLYISPLGYSIFEIPQTVDIASSATNKTYSKFNLFSKICNLLFSFNLSPEQLDDQILAIQDGKIPSTLHTFIEDHVHHEDNLHVPLPSLIHPLQSSFYSLNFINNETTQTFHRSIKFHFIKYIPSNERADLIAKRRHLSHLIFRKSLSFDFARSDENLVQTYGLYISTKKSVKRLKDTLISEVQDNLSSRQVSIDNEKNNEEDNKDKKDNNGKSVKKVKKRKESKTLKVTPKNVLKLAEKQIPNSNEIKNTNESMKWIVSKLKSNSETLKTIKTNLKNKVQIVAPNLNNLVGTMVTCELILRAGSLLKLAQCTSNIIQFFGAERELFQALKKRQNTPKYGVLAESLKAAKKKEKESKIGKKNKSNKRKGKEKKGKELGKLVRSYSVKCSLAAKVDAYKTEGNDGSYGKQLKKELKDKFK